MNKDAYGKVLKLAFPAVLESFLVSLIHTADTAMVGALGNEAIDAVGISNQPVSIALSFIFALNVGVTAIISRRYGAKDRDAANHCLKQSFVLCAFFSLILSGLIILFARPFLSFAGANDLYLDDAVLYTRIVVCGMTFTALSQTLTAGIRACGNMIVSMVANGLANVTNLVLNYLLIAGNLGCPALGVMGAALASLTGYMISFAVPLIYVLSKKHFLSFHAPVSWKPDRETLSLMARISGSAVLEQVVFCRIGYFLCAKIFASLGVMEYAAHQIVASLESFGLLLSNGFGVAAATLLGQSMGVQKPQVAQRYVRICQFLCFLATLGLSAVFVWLRDPIVSLYTDDPDTIALASQVLILVCLSFMPLPFGGLYVTVLRVAGDTKFVAFGTMFIVTFLRPGLGYLLAYTAGLGLYGAWLACVADQLARFIIFGIRFRQGKWKQIHI